ncbi:MAG TPA: response regulator transcription factor [Burkholderiaceae bacterium]|nr:response regulator transcription factor [Burkholderiaceae bacterium]
MSKNNAATRILIADDHAIMREGLRRILATDASFTVAGEAKNGQEVLDAVRAGGFDVVLLDLSMPGRSGIELLRQVKNERPELRVLVLSMHDEQQYAVRAIRAGASGYLSKDTAGGQLVAALHKIATGALFITPAVAEALAMQLQAPTEELPHRRLTDREYEVFLLLAGGASVTEIGERLHLSVKTVSTHKANILEKMQLGSLADLVRYAIANQLLDWPDIPR